MTETEMKAFLTYRLDELIQTAMTKASKAYKEQIGLNIRELRVVRAIGDKPGISSKALSGVTFIEQTLVSKHLRKLIADGYVRRDIESSDARRVALSLTDSGLLIRTRAQLLGEQLERDFLSVLTSDEQKTLDGCITKLADWASKETAEPGSEEVARQSGREDGQPADRR
jgi:DNA-binding MarR family transcriptional regulator